MRNAADSTTLASSSAYGRASWLYHTVSHATAVMPAAISPSALPYSRRPSANIAGMVAMPNSADGSRSSASESPTTRLQTNMSIQYPGT